MISAAIGARMIAASAPIGLPPFVVVAAAEDHLELGHLGDEADGAADRRGDRADERVAVLDVAQLVGEDAASAGARP